MKLLAREGFYDDVPFHRVIDGFMAQTGDGENGDGTGGSDHPDLPAEFSKVPFERGTVGMARTSNPNSANSQFFIMFDEGSFLNGQYTVVGEVVAGMDVVDKLKRGEPPSKPDPMAPRCRWPPTWWNKFMRASRIAIVIVCGTICVGGHSATSSARQLNHVTPARAPCSVLSGHPCHPSFCSVFQRGPCFPNSCPRSARICG